MLNDIRETHELSHLKAVNRQLQSVKVLSDFLTGCVAPYGAALHRTASYGAATQRIGSGVKEAQLMASLSSIGHACV